MVYNGASSSSMSSTSSSSSCLSSSIDVARLNWNHLTNPPLQVYDITYLHSLGNRFLISSSTAFSQPTKWDIWDGCLYILCVFSKRINSLTKHTLHRNILVVVVVFLKKEILALWILNSKFLKTKENLFKKLTTKLKMIKIRVKQIVLWE